MTDTRIDRRFKACADAGRPALVTFITAGDPDLQTSQALLNALPAAGADVIELGMPFSDPMAEGIPIQLGNQRALAAGHTMDKTLDMVREFRKQDQDTPIILMGYYNPIYVRDPKVFVQVAKDAGVDGFIIVDIPAEADDELCIPALEAGLNFIRLATPTTDDKRLPAVLANTSGFVYYVSVTGITGERNELPPNLIDSVQWLRGQTDLPICIGFGISGPETAAKLAPVADGLIVGSAIVRRIAEHSDPAKARDAVAEFVGELRTAIDQAYAV